MSEDIHFKTKYLGLFAEPSEEYLLCYKYLIKYYYECERFDQFVCSGRDKNGEALPTDAHERGLSNKFALDKIREITEQLRAYGIYTNCDAYRKARRDISRLSPRGLEWEYNRLWKEV